MADLDSGHIFLTTLAPIKPEVIGAKSHVSNEQRVRIALSETPTALQSPATQQTGINSPFSRNKRNHLARMFVIDDVVYNGRNGQNAIIALLKKVNLLTPQKVDCLNASYLVFCADIDAINQDGDPLPTNLTAAQQKQVRRSYAMELWQTMGPELDNIYSNCIGFDDVKTADDFADYLEKCHVETTMPFHDYYTSAPKFHELPVKLLGFIIVVPLLITLVAFILKLFGVQSLPILGWNTLWTALIALLGFVLAIIFSLKYVNANGARPLAPAEFDDLPSVLKSLYLQQKFSDFVVKQQGKSADQLYAAFGSFLDKHSPDNKFAPTQSPGVISSAAKGGLVKSKPRPNKGDTA